MHYLGPGPQSAQNEPPDAHSAPYLGPGRQSALYGQVWTDTHDPPKPHTLCSEAKKHRKAEPEQKNPRTVCLKHDSAQPLGACKGGKAHKTGEAACGVTPMNASVCLLGLDFEGHPELTRKPARKGSF